MDNLYAVVIGDRVCSGIPAAYYRIDDKGRAVNVTYAGTKGVQVAVGRWITEYRLPQTTIIWKPIGHTEDTVTYRKIVRSL